MNAQQRRRMKRIKQRQRESAERRLTRGDRQFVIAHTLKSRPTRVCVMTEAQAHRFQDVGIDYRCTSIHHRHYTNHHVDRLVNDGVVKRIGQHEKVAMWVREVHWETRGLAMQLLPGSYSKKGASQDVQPMPQLSRFQGGRPVAMLNDGRVE